MNTFGKALFQILKVYESVPHSDTYIDVWDEAFGIYCRGKKDSAYNSPKL